MRSCRISYASSPALPPEQQTRFLTAVRKLVEDLRAGKAFRPSLRVKGVQGHPNIYEMTWASDGRDTFEYGPEVRPGDTHITWRRIGTHEISRIREALPRPATPCRLL